MDVMISMDGLISLDSTRATTGIPSACVYCTGTSVSCMAACRNKKKMYAYIPKLVWWVDQSEDWENRLQPQCVPINQIRAMECHAMQVPRTQCIGRCFSMLPFNMLVEMAQL